MRCVCLVVLVACGASANEESLGRRAPPPVSSGTSYAAATARAFATIADQTCACKDEPCASAAAMDLMVFARDLGELTTKIPRGDATPDPETALLGEVDLMAGVDACWMKRAEWEARRASDCIAHIGGRTTGAEPAPRCTAVSDPEKPAIEEWWTAKAPCPSGTTFETKQRDALEIKRCMHPDGRAVGRTTAWWIGTRMPAYSGTYDERGAPHGAWTHWFHDGKVAATGAYLHGDPSGTWTRWYPNGQKRDERMYAASDPAPRAWWPDGKQRTEKINQFQTYWYRDGTKAAEIAIRKGVRDGRVRHWHPNGAVKLRGTWEAGKRHGTWEYGDEAGKLVNTEEWKHGELVAAPASVKPKVTAASLLTEDMVRGVAGFTGKLRLDTLAPSTTSYDDVHYRAIETSESFDVAIRLWLLDPKAAKAKFDELVQNLPTAKPIKLADRAVSAEEPNVVGISFLDRRGLVVLLTCGKGQCPTVTDATRLAQQVHARLPETW
jgi:hypothetical protein